MFTIEENLRFITIDLNYVKRLNSVCSEVFYKENGYENKPYLGILINDDSFKYVVPLTSAKEKHKNIPDFSNGRLLIYEIAVKTDLSSSDIWVNLEDGEKVKHILSVLDIKKMIPIRDDVISFVDINVKDSDSIDEKRYKNLLNKEYSFCVGKKEEILSEVNKIYSNQKSSGKVQMFCCDFTKLEQECLQYNQK